MRFAQRGSAQWLILIILLFGMLSGLVLIGQEQIFKSRANATLSLESFKAAFNTCQGEANYSFQYDADRDGCVTFRDYKLVRPSFQSNGGSPSPTPTSRPSPSPTNTPTPTPSPSPSPTPTSRPSPPVMTSSPIPTIIPSPSPATVGTPTPSPTPVPQTSCTACSADVDRNGTVTHADVGRINQCIGLSPNQNDRFLNQPCAPSDTTGNGIIDIDDYMCSYNNLGQTCSR